jgi:alpha-galactosidase
MGDIGDGVVWQAHGSAEDMVVLVTRTQPTTMRHQPNLRLPMAVPGRTYTIASDSGVLARMDGGWLARVGMAVPPLPGEAVLVLEVRS